MAGERPTPFDALTHHPNVDRLVPPRLQVGDDVAMGRRKKRSSVVAPIDRPKAALSSLQDQAQTFVAQAESPIQIGDALRTRATPPRYDAHQEYAAAERAAEPASGSGLCWMLPAVRAWPELRSRMAMLLASRGDSSRWLRYQALAAAHAGDTATLTRLDRWLSVAIDSATGTRLAELLAERARVAALRGNGDEAIELLQQAFAHNKAFDAYVHTDPSFETIWSDVRFNRLLVTPDDARHF